MNDSFSYFTMSRPVRSRRHTAAGWRSGVLAVLILLTGCAGPPIGADFAGPHGSYTQVEQSAITSQELSAGTLSLLHRHDLERRAATDPGAVLQALYPVAMANGERDLLFVLAELSYRTAESIRLKHPGATPDLARDHYLGAAVYAYLFLFGEATGNPPDGFDRRFRTACDLYNYGLGLALTTPRSAGAAVAFPAGVRRLPVGTIQLQLDATAFPWKVEDFEQFLVGDHFRVRGLSVRNREAGIGTPLIAQTPVDPALFIRRSVPATAVLRVAGDLAALAHGEASGSVELHSAYGATSVTMAGKEVPLEIDVTVAHAHMLNQELAWDAGRFQFFAAARAARSQIILSEPYQPGRVPVVLVHGTFSSPVWWAEMINTLNADPVLRERYQIWLFLYSSSKPIEVSANELRTSLTELVHECDPNGTDPSLRQMTLVGHSQGGLLLKLAATNTGDALWRVFSERAPDELDITDEQRRLIRLHLYYEALPFVRRVVFIATPHRGSYRARPFTRNLARRFISLPKAVIEKSAELIQPTEGVILPEIFRGGRPNSLDEMSPDNPVLRALADVPVAPGIKAHSIIAVEGDGDIRQGRDGVVAYESAHLEHVESELVVRGPHSCQSMPPTIAEVRRILHEHLAELARP